MLLSTSLHIGSNCVEPRWPFITPFYWYASTGLGLWVATSLAHQSTHVRRGSSVDWIMASPFGVQLKKRSTKYTQETRPTPWGTNLKKFTTTTEMSEKDGGFKLRSFGKNQSSSSGSKVAYLETSGSGEGRGGDQLLLHDLKQASGHPLTVRL